MYKAGDKLYCIKHYYFNGLLAKPGDIIFIHSVEISESFNYTYYELNPSCLGMWSKDGIDEYFETIQKHRKRIIEEIG